MFEINESVSSDYVELHLKGKLTKQAYDEFAPEFDALIRRRGKVRLLVVMTDFEGWDLEGVWEDSKFAYQHYRDIERIAVVGDSRWEAWMTLFCRPFTTAKVRYFEAGDSDDARRWLAQERVPLHHQLLKAERVLVVSPSDPLTEDDFRSVSQEIDPFIASHGALRGLMIDAPSFPGWAGLSSMMAHFRFVREHHDKIERVALVTDDSVLSHLPGFAGVFVAAELKHFPHAEKPAAMDWLLAAPQTGAKAP